MHPISIFIAATFIAVGLAIASPNNRSPLRLVTRTNGPHGTGGENQLAQLCDDYKIVTQKIADTMTYVKRNDCTSDETLNLLKVLVKVFSGVTESSTCNQSCPEATGNTPIQAMFHKLVILIFVNSQSLITALLDKWSNSQSLFKNCFVSLEDAFKKLLEFLSSLQFDMSLVLPKINPDVFVKVGIKIGGTIENGSGHGRPTIGSEKPDDDPLKPTCKSYESIVKKFKEIRSYVKTNECTSKQTISLLQVVINLFNEIPGCDKCDKITHGHKTDIQKKFEKLFIRIFVEFGKILNLVEKKGSDFVKSLSECFTSYEVVFEAMVKLALSLKFDLEAIFAKFDSTVFITMNIDLGKIFGIDSGHDSGSHKNPTITPPTKTNPTPTQPTTGGSIIIITGSFENIIKKLEGILTYINNPDCTLQQIIVLLKAFIESCQNLPNCQDCGQKNIESQVQTLFFVIFIKFGDILSILVKKFTDFLKQFAVVLESLNGCFEGLIRLGSTLSINIQIVPEKVNSDTYEGCGIDIDQIISCKGPCPARAPLAPLAPRSLTHKRRALHAI